MLKLFDIIFKVHTHLFISAKSLIFFFFFFKVSCVVITLNRGDTERSAGFCFMWTAPGTGGVYVTSQHSKNPLRQKALKNPVKNADFLVLIHG